MYTSHSSVYHIHNCNEGCKYAAHVQRTFTRVEICFSLEHIKRRRFLFLCVLINLRVLYYNATHTKKALNRPQNIYDAHVFFPQIKVSFICVFVCVCVYMFGCGATHNNTEGVSSTFVHALGCQKADVEVSSSFACFFFLSTLEGMRFELYYIDFVHVKNTHL